MTSVDIFTMHNCNSQNSFCQYYYMNFGQKTQKYFALLDDFVLTNDEMYGIILLQYKITLAFNDLR